MIINPNVRKSVINAMRAFDDSRMYIFDKLYNEFHLIALEISLMELKFYKKYTIKQCANYYNLTENEVNRRLNHIMSRLIYRKKMTYIYDIYGQYLINDNKNRRFYNIILNNMKKEEEENESRNLLEDIKHDINLQKEFNIAIKIFDPSRHWIIFKLYNNVHLSLIELILMELRFYKKYTFEQCGKYHNFDASQVLYKLRQVFTRQYIENKESIIYDIYAQDMANSGKRNDWFKHIGVSYGKNNVN